MTCLKRPIAQGVWPALCTPESPQRRQLKKRYAKKISPFYFKLIDL